jgi:hypothetical protein
MIRNLKVLIVAAMALGAFGALGASGAQAAEPLFHCSSEPCTLTLKPDGTVGTKTAHHLFTVKNSVPESVGFTCNQLSGEATPKTKTETTITVTNLKYSECIETAGLTKVEVRTNGCDYTFTSHGKVGVTCPIIEGVEKVIEVEIVETGCIAKVGSFNHLSGIKYHNLAGPPREVTVEAAVANIPVSLVGTTKAQCKIDPTKTPITSEYNTGNTIVTAETHAGVMIEGWWE